VVLVASLVLVAVVLADWVQPAVVLVGLAAQGGSAAVA
jgi:hypothetical protein